MSLRATAVLGAMLLSTAALARGGSDSGVGFGVLIPESDLSDVNDPSYYLQARTVFAEKTFGGRAGVYYGDTTAHPPIDGGRVYGFDLEGLVRFGGRQTYGYAFAGAGYGRATFSRTSSLPGVVVRSSEWDWSMQGGIGVVIKKVVYVEAQYVEFQTNPKADFIPVVIGFQY